MEQEVHEQVALQTGSEAAIKEMMQPDTPLVNASQQATALQIILEFRQELEETMHGLLGEEWNPETEKWEKNGVQVMSELGARSIHALLRSYFRPNIVLTKMDDWEIRKHAHAAECMLLDQLYYNSQAWEIDPTNWAYIKHIVVRAGVYPALRRAQEGMTFRGFTTMNRQTEIKTTSVVPQRGGLINIQTGQGGGY